VTHGDWAWIALASAILGYEVRAPEGQLLSEAVDRYRARHPFITNAVILAVSLHLMRAIPPRFDPLHRLAARR
jgi:hypothetical protein